jgi:putative FmdB family regulatory protein
MPIYEYKCRECDLVFEVLKRSRLSENDPECCPGCGGEEADKLYSSFAGMVPVAAGGGGCPSAGSGGACGGGQGGFS